MVVLATPTCLTGTALTLALALALAGCGGGGAVDAPAATPARMASADIVVTSATTVSEHARLVLAPQAAAIGAPLALSSQLKGAAAAAPLATDTIFAPTSFWYTAIPANAPLHANSANFVGEFLRQKKAYYGTVNLNTSAYASPVYIAQADTPATAVAFNNCQKKTFAETGLIAQWTNVPIPAVAAPADGSDAEMTIYQPSTDTLWEFWVSKKADGAWSACWGGKMNNVSANDGTWPLPYGTTATGLPFLGGQITAEELARGEIRHAIGISLVDAEHFSTFSWPARRSDGYNPAKIANRIPEGLRLRLDPAINVDALSMTPVGRIIAKAAQKYGFVVWDKAGALSLRLQNPKSYTALGKPDPYPALFAGKAAYAQLDGFPWERLQFLPLDYGKP
jgi:hypothetical protein